MVNFMRFEWESMVITWWFEWEFTSKYGDLMEKNDDFLWHLWWVYGDCTMKNGDFMGLHRVYRTCDIKRGELGNLELAMAGFYTGSWWGTVAKLDSLRVKQQHNDNGLWILQQPNKFISIGEDLLGLPPKKPKKLWQFHPFHPPPLDKHVRFRPRQRHHEEQIQQSGRFINPCQPQTAPLQYDTIKSWFTFLRGHWTGLYPFPIPRPPFQGTTCENHAMEAMALFFNVCNERTRRSSN